MKALFRLIALAALLSCSGAFAQFALPTTCTPITGTIQLPAPGSGSITITNLTPKYPFAAQVCVGGTFNVANGYTYDLYAAITFNNATSTCGGNTWRVNGGPVYAYFSGKGTLGVSGSSISGTGLYQYDNLTVSINNGTPHTVSSGIITGTYSNVTNAAGATTNTFKVPKAGLQMTVDGQNLAVTADLYQCLAGGTGVSVVSE